MGANLTFIYNTNSEKEDAKMDVSKMTVIEIEEKLEELWNRADSISPYSDEYYEIVDKVLSIRKHCLENNILLKQSVTVRF